MKTFYTSVIELRQEFTGAVETHPYECGWADEALFFVEVEDAAPGAVVSLRVQLSADGIRWIDEGTVLVSSDRAFARITHFGGFLRLAGSTAGSDGEPTPVSLTVRLALKG